jgi:ABC-2 type transport system ATP-binding protein
MSDDTAIRIDHVSKSFKLPHEITNTIKSALVNLRGGRGGYEIHKVLDDISFEIKKGEFFGIVGRNGSGKSTLLKLLAGIYSPDKGVITVNGKLTPFIELGVGFNPDLTGRENVYLNGALLGFNRKEMAAMYDEIVEFAELERFMDQKLKNYSSGMQVRLAFSIAIRANTDILVLDEVLAVGDTAFQQKCYDYFGSLRNNNKTVILVSHSMGAIERFCTRALLLEEGKIVKTGTSKQIATLYENMFIEDANKTQLPKEGKTSHGNFKVKADIIQGSKTVKTVRAFEQFTLRFSIKSNIVVERFNFGVNIRSIDGATVFSEDMRKFYQDVHVEKDGETEIEFHIDNYFTNNTYFVDIAIVNEGLGGDKALLVEDGVAKFQVAGVRDHAHALFHPPTSVEVNVSQD